MNVVLLVQLIWLLSVPFLFIDQAVATSCPATVGNAYRIPAVNVLADVCGGNAVSRSSATDGGSAGRITVKTGVDDIYTGDGSLGPLTYDITLKSGTYNYTYVYMDIAGGSATPPTITIDGNVTINCQGLFAPFVVVGLFRPDQESPRVRINAGHPIITISGIPIKVYHSAPFSMSAQNMNPAPNNSDGSGIFGGSVEFYTSEAGDILCSSLALGGMGMNGGDGGDGGVITVVATGGNVLSGVESVEGGSSGGSLVPGYGGSGGDGGSIYLSGIKIVNALGEVTQVPPCLSADGGDGGAAWPFATIDYPCGGKGGDGGKGGGIAVCGELSGSVSFQTTAIGGNGERGGNGYYYPAVISGSGRNGYPGGVGGDGGAPGVIVGLTGTTTPGNGGDGGWGGRGEAGHWRTSPLPMGYDSPGGNGGVGGEGGNSGGAGAQPGKGGTGGLGGAGNPHGADGAVGQDGVIGDQAPVKPPTDGTEHYTYVLCVGTRDQNIKTSGFIEYLQGDIGAGLVADAFNRLPNLSLLTKTVKLDTSNPSNSSKVLQAIVNAANRLEPGDNFIFYINCHGLGGDGDIAFGLSRSGQLYPTWIYDAKDEVFTSWLSGGVWGNVSKLFIIDCCYAFGCWDHPQSERDLASLPRSAIIAACTNDSTSSAITDTNSPLPSFLKPVWGELGQALVLALDSLSGEKQITFQQLADRTIEKGKIFAGQDGIISDESTNFSIRTTCVWAPVWTNSSSFALKLDLTPAVPIGFSVTKGICADKVRIAWSASSGATNYQVYRATADNVSQAASLGATADISYDDATAVKGTRYYYWVKAIDVHGASDFSASDYGYLFFGPEIKVNGKDGPLHIATIQNVVVTAGMEPGEYVGYPVDWWVVAQALGGWYYLNASMQWTPITDFGQIHPVYQGGLFPLAPRTIFEMSTLPVGAYTFYFGVDQMNGRLDLDSFIWYDSVSFEVQ